MRISGVKGSSFAEIKRIYCRPARAEPSINGAGFTRVSYLSYLGFLTDVAMTKGQI